MANQRDGMVSKAGKPSNRAKALGGLMVARDPSSVAPTVFPRAGEPYELVPEVGVEAKFSAISSGISGGLGFVADSAATRVGEARGLRPWVDDVSPLIRLESIEAEYAKNEALIDALTAHLVEHVVIREELRSQAERARRQAALENRRIPEYMEEFGQRLVAAGVLKGDLRFLPKARFESIVGILRGLAEKDLDVSPLISDWDAKRPPEGVFPQGSDEGRSAAADRMDEPVRHIMPISGEGDPEAGDGAAGTVSEGAGTVGADGVDDGGSEGVSPMGDMPSEAESEPVSEPSVEVTYERSEPVAEVPVQPVSEVAPGRWDVLEIERLGYEVDEVQPTTDEESGALRMKLPEMDSLDDMALRTGMEATWLSNVKQFGDLAIAERLVRAWAQRNSVRMSDRDVRVWVFLLVVARDIGRTVGTEELAKFDGLVLPGRKGSSKVRRVRWAGE